MAALDSLSFWKELFESQQDTPDDQGERPRLFSISTRCHTASNTASLSRRTRALEVEAVKKLHLRIYPTSLKPNTSISYKRNTLTGSKKGQQIFLPADAFINIPNLQLDP